MEQRRNMARLTAPNPELEELRNNVTSRVNVDTLVVELRTLTNDIHATYLFEDRFDEVLQIICGWVGAADTENAHTHWMEFASYLRVTRVQMKNIQKYFQHMNGPVWWALASYAQWHDATISEVIHALQRTEREDIINNISHGVRALVRQVSSSTDVQARKAGIPPPWVDLVLRPPQSEKKHRFIIVNIPVAISNIPEHNSNETIDNAETPFALTIMLTFAHDGVEAANRITKILRAHRPKIGVLLLNEQMPHVFAKDLEFVEDCIQQMDIVMPILTPGYFDVINRRPITTEVSPSSFGKDEECAKYIFDYLRGEFSSRGCVNERVGSILPNGHELPIPVSPVLKIWHRESRIDKFLEMCLLLKKMRL